MKTVDEIQQEKNEYFRSLIHSKPIKKKRKCLGLECGTEFVSDGPHHRVCCFCAEKHEKYSVKAEEAFLG